MTSFIFLLNRSKLLEKSKDNSFCNKEIPREKREKKLIMKT